MADSVARAGALVALAGDGWEIAARYRYEPSGEQWLIGEMISQPLGFPGRPLDLTAEFYIVRARWYDPEPERARPHPRASRPAFRERIASFHPLPHTRESP